MVANLGVPLAEDGVKSKQKTQSEATCRRGTKQNGGEGREEEKAGRQEVQKAAEGVNLVS